MVLKENNCSSVVYCFKNNNLVRLWLQKESSSFHTVTEGYSVQQKLLSISDLMSKLCGNIYRIQASV